MSASDLEHKSVAFRIIHALIQRFGGEGARAVVRTMFSKLGVIHGAALRYTWAFWGRPKQQWPESEDWKYHGFLTGRGFGKTLANASQINEAIERGEYRSIGMAAQDEDNCIAIQVLGPSGLIATSPPWFRPVWDATHKTLKWKNGAVAYVRTPEVPGKIRGLEYDFSWVTELQSWPKTKMIDAWSNGFQFSTRIGKARIVWDSTPKRRHPILLELLADAENDTGCTIVRGTTHENSENLARNYLDKLERKYGGTTKGREEIGGEMVGDSDSALFKDAWLIRNRRPMPEAFIRKGISVDPATTSAKGSDTTGIVLGGLALDGKAVVWRNLSGKYPVGAWAKILVDEYVAGAFDFMMVEKNKGGDLCTQIIRAEAKPRGLQVVVVGDEEKPRHTRGVIHVKERYARGAKEDRAQPVATAYERNRVCHVEGEGIEALEDTLTTWEPDPSADSPGDLDALVHLVVELLDLSHDLPDPSVGMKGIAKANQQLRSNTSGIARDISRLLSGHGRTI